MKFWPRACSRKSARLMTPASTTLPRSMCKTRSFCQDSAMRIFPLYRTLTLLLWVLLIYTHLPSCNYKSLFLGTPKCVSFSKLIHQLRLLPTVHRNLVPDREVPSALREQRCHLHRSQILLERGDWRGDSPELASHRRRTWPAWRKRHHLIHRWIC